MNTRRFNREYDAALARRVHKHIDRTHAPKGGTVADFCARLLAVAEAVPPTRTKPHPFPFCTAECTHKSASACSRAESVRS